MSATPWTPEVCAAKMMERGHTREDAEQIARLADQANNAANAAEWLAALGEIADINRKLED